MWCHVYCSAPAPTFSFNYATLRSLYARTHAHTHTHTYAHRERKKQNIPCTILCTFVSDSRKLALCTPKSVQQLVRHRPKWSSVRDTWPLPCLLVYERKMLPRCRCKALGLHSLPCPRVDKPTDRAWYKTGFFHSLRVRQPTGKSQSKPDARNWLLCMHRKEPTSVRHPAGSPPCSRESSLVTPVDRKRIFGWALPEMYISNACIYRRKVYFLYFHLHVYPATKIHESLDKTTYCQYFQLPIYINMCFFFLFFLSLSLSAPHLLATSLTVVSGMTTVRLICWVISTSCG